MADKQAEATAKLFDKIADVADKVSKMEMFDSSKLEFVKASLLGPIIMACGTIADRARGIKENRDEDKYNKTMSDSKEAKETTSEGIEER